MWDDILKTPLYVGADFEQPKNSEGDDFVWLTKFNENEWNVKFISKDGQVRATLTFSDEDNIGYGSFVWLLDLFVVNAPLRGQGLGENGVLELIDTIRMKEPVILRKLLDIVKSKSQYGHENTTLIKNLERAIEEDEPLPIKLGEIDPEADGFWNKMIQRHGSETGLQKMWESILKVQVLGSKQKVKQGIKPLPKEDDKPIPENEEPPNCKEYVVEIDQLIKDFLRSFDAVSEQYKLNDFYHEGGMDRKREWPTMNYSTTTPHREANHYYYFDELTSQKDPMELSAMDYHTMKMPVAWCTFTWASGDNISEKDACQLLELINLSSDYESLISIENGYDMTEFDSTEYWNRVDAWTALHDGFGFDQVIRLRVGLRTFGNYSQYNKNKLPLEREKEIHTYLNIMNLQTKLFFSNIFRIAKRWKDAGGTLKKSAEHPLGPITEYHGTMDIERVMKQGLHGGKTNKRSNKHIPKQLRKAERITYSSDNKKEALKFAQGRARQLGIALTKVGVVGIRARDLEEPIEHIDSRWVERGASVLVREGGIPKKYLERV